MLPKDTVESEEVTRRASEAENALVKELEKENLDLKITNRGKNFFIEQLQKERTGILGQLLQTNRKVGELESKLLQLGDGRA